MCWKYENDSTLPTTAELTRNKKALFWPTKLAVLFIHLSMEQTFASWIVLAFPSVYQTTSVLIWAHLRFWVGTNSKLFHSLVPLKRPICREGNLHELNGIRQKAPWPWKSVTGTPCTWCSPLETSVPFGRHQEWRNWRWNKETYLIGRNHIFYFLKPMKWTNTPVIGWLWPMVLTGSTNICQLNFEYKSM